MRESSQRASADLYRVHWEAITLAQRPVQTEGWAVVGGSYFLAQVLKLRRYKSVAALRAALDAGVENSPAIAH